MEFVGETPNPESNDLDVTVDLSLETLTSDFLALLQTVFPDPKTSPAFIVSFLCPSAMSDVPCSPSHACSPLPIQLVGHSMGAAPVLEVTPRLQKLGYKVPGVVVLDVVEGWFPSSTPLTIASLRSPKLTVPSHPGPLSFQAQRSRLSRSCPGSSRTDLRPSAQ